MRGGKEEGEKGRGGGKEGVKGCDVEGLGASLLKLLGSKKKR